jgi:hypothetical protein
MLSDTNEEQDQLTLGNVFACTMKFSNFGIQAYWHPDEVYHLEPANLLKRLWPKPEGSLREASWHPYMGMFVADVSNNEESWQAYLDNARLKAASPDVDLYDFNQ